jgi:hypothetical protein
MTPLGVLDALFLHLETAATPMHVGALHLLDAPTDTDLFAAIERRRCSGGAIARCHWPSPIRCGSTAASICRST